MTFGFDNLIDRTNTDSVKWAFPERLLSPEEHAQNPLPMWIADMDFKAPQPVIDALREAVEKGLFGYPNPTRGYIEAVCNWQERRFGWKPEPEWIVQTPGVVTALNIIIQAFSRPGDSVLVQTPVYGHFHQDALANGRQVAYAPLQIDGNEYRFDAREFEEAIRPDTKLFILCNPHNPTGTVWSEDDLRQMGEICLRRNILVVSDEIHQDLVLNPQKKHIPFASLGGRLADNCIVCTAPSKTFNIAGLQVSNIFIPNQDLRAEFSRQLIRHGINFVNSLGMVACEAAYRHGEAWLDALLVYIRENHEHFAAEVHKSLPKLQVFKADALYLAWMDCRQLWMHADELSTFMLTKAGLWFDRGEKFGPQGAGFMRVNLGCPRATVDLAIERLRAAIS